MQELQITSVYENNTSKNVEYPRSITLLMKISHKEKIDQTADRNKDLDENQQGKMLDERRDFKNKRIQSFCEIRSPIEWLTENSPQLLLPTEKNGSISEDTV